jgi:hypothetical protein
MINIGDAVSIQGFGNYAVVARTRNNMLILKRYLDESDSAIVPESWCIRLQIGR